MCRLSGVAVTLLPAVHRPNADPDVAPRFTAREWLMHGPSWSTFALERTQLNQPNKMLDAQTNAGVLLLLLAAVVLCSTNISDQPTGDTTVTAARPLRGLRLKSYTREAGDHGTTHRRAQVTVANASDASHPHESLQGILLQMAGEDTYGRYIAIPVLAHTEARADVMLQLPASGFDNARNGGSGAVVEVHGAYSIHRSVKSESADCNML